MVHDVISIIHFFSVFPEYGACAHTRTSLAWGDIRHSCNPMLAICVTPPGGTCVLYNGSAALAERRLGPWISATSPSEASYINTQLESVKVLQLNMTSFTPDSQLDLLFDPSLIPTSFKQSLPDDLHIRPLASTDVSRSHFHVLSVLSPSPTPSQSAYTAHFNTLRSINESVKHLNLPPTYVVIAIIKKDNDQIVATGTVFMEHKFLRGLSLVGHIEDIAVDKAVQGKRLGLRVVTALTEISEALGAYKTILNCSLDNIPFYEKCGYKQKEREMARYKEPAPTPAQRL